MSFFEACLVSGNPDFDVLSVSLNTIVLTGRKWSGRV